MGTRKNIIKFFWLSLIALIFVSLVSCTDDSSTSVRDDNIASTKTLAISIDKASTIPVLNGNQTQVGLYIHNTTSNDISGIKYSISNSNSGSHLTVNDSSCHSIKAHDSCMIGLTTPTLSPLSGGSDLLIAQYGDKQSSQLINYKYVNTSQYDKVTFGGMSIELNGPDDYGTVYVFAGGNRGFKYIGFKSSNNSVEVVNGLQGNNQVDIPLNEVVALEVVTTQNITNRVASITPVYENALSPISLYYSNDLDVTIEPALRSPNLIMSNISLLTVDNNHAVINVYNSGNEAAHDISLAVISGDHIVVSNGQTPCTTLLPQTMCQYNVELNGASTSGSSIVELSYDGEPHRHMAIYYQNNLGSPMLGINVSSDLINESTGTPAETTFTLMNYGGSPLDNVVMQLTSRISGVTTNIIDNDCGNSIAIHQICHVKAAITASDPKFDYEGIMYLSVNGTDQNTTNYHFVSSPVVVVLEGLLPKLVSLIPYDDSYGVSSYTGITLNFNRPMDPLSLNDNAVRLIDNDLNVTIPISLQGVTNNNQTVSYIQTSGHLDPFKHYSVIINPSMIRAVNGYVVDENKTESIVAVFMTGDDVAPTIDTVAPPSGMTDVSGTPAMKVQFSEPIDPDTINNSSVMLVPLDSSLSHRLSRASLANNTNNTALEYTVNYNPDDYSVIVMLADGVVLDSNRGYQIVLNKTLIKDVAGNVLGDDPYSVVSSFTTGDFIAPELVSVNPPNGAMGIIASTDIQLTFSEAMDSSTLNTTNIRLLNKVTNQEIALTNVLYDSVTHRVSLKPVSNLSGFTAYNIVLDERAIRDVSGNLLGVVSDKVVGSFTTAYTSNGWMYVGSSYVNKFEKNINNQVYVNFYKAVAASDNLFVAVGSIGINISNDGLKFRQVMLESLTYPLNDVTFNKANGLFVASGNAGLTLTSSDGITWTQRYITTSSRQINSMVCNESNVCIGVGNAGLIIKSTNGGITWVNSSFGTSNFVGITCSPSGLFVAIANNGVAARTMNGDNWLSSDIGFSNVRDITVSKNGIFMVAGRNAIATSNDGITWTMRVFYDIYSEDIAVNDSGVFVITSSSGAEIFTSIDNGVSWTKTWSNSGQVQNIGAITARGNRFTAVRSMGYDAVSSDNGFDWFSQLSSEDYYFNLRKIIFDSQRKLFIATGLNRVLLSYDYGKTWVNSLPETMLATANRELNASAISNNGTIIAVGTKGAAPNTANIFRSSDSGVSWSEVGTYSDQLNDVIFVNGMFVAVGTKDTIYTSIDDGVTWVLRRSSTDELIILNNIIYTNSGTYIAVGSNNNVPYVLTSLNTDTWDVRDVSSVVAVGSLIGIACSSSGKILAINQRGEVLRSENNGASWVLASQPMGYANGGIAVNSQGEFFLTFSYNALISTNNGTTWTAIPVQLNNASNRSLVRAATSY